MKIAILFVRLCAGLLIFLAVLEVCARVDDYLTYDAPLWSSYSIDGLYTQDQLGKRGKPYGRYKKWQLNSLGYRDPELRPGTTRIVCLGASETFGLYESAGEEYPRQLERDLNARAGGNDFQVVNAAYAGQTVATASLRVPEILEKVNPRVVIIYPAPTEYIWLRWLGPAVPAKSALVVAGKSPKFELRVAENLRVAAKSMLPGFLQTGVREYQIARAAVRYKLMDRLPEENIARLRSDVAHLVGLLKVRGVEPVLVTHATVFGKQLSPNDRELLIAWRKFYPMLREEGFLDMELRMNDAMRSVAAEEQVTLVDAAREIPSDPKYFADFSHFTDMGASLMAAKLAHGLEPLTRTQSARQPGSTRSQETAAGRGAQ